MKKILFVIAVVSFASFAQITITSSDIASTYGIGNSTTVHESDATTPINIGSPGGGNNWDFSMLQGNFTYELTSVDPNTTPYINEFTDADIATYIMGEYEGEQAEIWQYLTLNGSFDNMGSAITLTSQPGVVITIKNNPHIHEVEFPFTYNTSWMQTYTQTTEFNGTPISTFNYATDVLVDAYGTMTLPGGLSFEALRERWSETVNGTTYVAYSFAAIGALVHFYATDANPPNSGEISISGYDWTLQTNSTVEQISDSPNDYSLRQNYPNPFNPTTNIEYSIPEATFVQLKVYDILGNEVATLVNDEQAAGSYRADFSVVNLSSGLYIAKLQADNYTKSIKMTLLR